MQPIHEVDVLLLLSLALAAKRRPAELIEIVAAIDLLNGAVPSETRLVESFARLATRGLIQAQGDGFTLTAEAEKIMAGTSRKAETAQRLQNVRDKLAAYEVQGDHPPIQLTAKTVCAAILAHRDSAKLTVRNLLVPKPAANDAPRPGQRQRRPLPAGRRKA